MATSIRSGYEKHGVSEFYASQGSSYRNPHEGAVRASLAATHEAWVLDLTHVLDLACGSGEVTLAAYELGAAKVDGVDPYTGDAYRDRTGQEAERLSFEDIGGEALDGRRYSLVVCSYALHLCPPSHLPRLLYALGRVCDTLLILSPHKRPVIAKSSGWLLLGEQYTERVRSRLFMRDLWND